MNKLFQSPFLAIPLFLAVGFLLVKVAGVYPQKVELDKRVGNLNTQIGENRLKIDELKSRANYYQSEEYKEKQARAQLNYKRLGEEVIFVYDNPGNVETFQVEDQKELQNWQKWVKYLFE